MGAYYEAVVEEVRYNPHSSSNGLKLMEHSYVGNSYVDSVMSLLEDKPNYLVWLCDYTEELGLYDWEYLEEDDSLDGSEAMSGEYYVVNRSKKAFIKIPEPTDELVIHPIPILCNSSTYSMGGGDYHVETKHRGIWRDDILEVTYQLDASLQSYEDLTEELKFYE